MGAEKISDSELTGVGVEIKKVNADGSRELVIPENRLEEYFELVEEKLEMGFWNEVVGAERIIFLFKLLGGEVKRYVLSPDSEQQIDALCAEFNNESSDNTANVYKYISENDFYHDFMMENYADMINR